MTEPPGLLCSTALEQTPRKLARRSDSVFVKGFSLARRSAATVRDDDDSSVRIRAASKRFGAYDLRIGWATGRGIPVVTLCEERVRYDVMGHARLPC
jgi:aspartate/methionine/tyrosine aminotransferase